MNVLVINCGSSSLKAAVMGSSAGNRIVEMRAERLGTSEARYRITDQWQTLENADHSAVLNAFLDAIKVDIDAVGHRVVHGGAEFKSAVRITPKVIAGIERCSALAPLHNPANLIGIHTVLERFPELLHVAVFDTAFHSTLPRRAKHYAMSNQLASDYGIQRYGFHGPSHQWVSNRAAEFLHTPVEDLRIITCHLGNGASVCAVEYGRSVETSMGMTPLEGLVMGTRCGDLDPGALLHLARSADLGIEQLDYLLNRESGLKGLSGVGNDLRDIRQRAIDGDDNCRLAINVFVHRLRKYIGAYSAVMGGVDAIVFTAGIGENADFIRARACQNLQFLGVDLDIDGNRDAAVSAMNSVALISTNRSRVKVLVVATDEEWSIAKSAAELAANLDVVNPVRGIPVAVSARHVHLTQAAVETLFGAGAELTCYREISQPGQFAAHQKVDLIGPKRSILGVRVIGPVRPGCQIEISRTDEYTLGIDAPVRDSGDIKGTPGIKLIGPAGELDLAEGVICARRHIHMHPDDAKEFGVQHRDVVEVAIDSDGRDLIFGDVLVRVSPKYVLEMHIDTDEANAAELSRHSEGMLVETTGRAILKRKKPSHTREEWQ